MTAQSGAIYSTSQVRELDRRAIEEFGVPGYELMTRAGHATVNALRGFWPGARSICVLCGAGNNGGAISPCFTVIQTELADELQVPVR